MGHNETMEMFETIAKLERELTALKLAATEQATQAEAVLEERTRARRDNQQTGHGNSGLNPGVIENQRIYLLSVEWCAPPPDWGTLGPGFAHSDIDL